MDHTRDPNDIFEDIKSALEQNLDIPLRQKASQLFIKQMYGWGVPWPDGGRRGGFGQATDLTIQAAYDVISRETPLSRDGNDDDDDGDNDDDDDSNDDD